MLHQDTLRYSIATIYRNIKLENNNQGMDDGGRLNEVAVGMANKRHKIPLVS